MMSLVRSWVVSLVSDIITCILEEAIGEVCLIGSW